MRSADDNQLHPPSFDAVASVRVYPWSAEDYQLTAASSTAVSWGDRALATCYIAQALSAFMAVVAAASVV